jgi:tetratricopeptide (TPR) repeat protein
MKKLLIAIAALTLSGALLSAQDLSQATELYNNGATALTTKDYTTALENFQKALEMGKSLGADGEELVTNCKNAIPGVALQIAKDLIQDSKYDEAKTKIDDAVKLATEYENNDVLTEAKELIPVMYTKKGADALKTKDYTGAAAAFKESYLADTTNGKTAITLAQLYGQLGKSEEAIDMLQHAAWNGEETEAKEQASTIYLREASSLLKSQKYADAVKAAEKANSYAENANAYLIAGQASQKLGKNNDAIENFTKYLDLKPNSSNSAAITFTVGALYQGANNKTKALEYYKKVQNDPKFGAQAKQMITALSK